MFTRESSRHLKKLAGYMHQHEHDVLRYLKTQFPMFHLSNFFFRDIQYGIQRYLLGQGISVSYAGAEHLAKAFVESMERSGIMRQVDGQSWTVMFPEFRTPEVKRAAAKPASTAAQPATTPG